jgi:quercetin dioxygenase-like cupin family protein
MPPRGTTPMHFTHSIDYGLLVEGEIELELDGGDKTLLKAG